jgi:uncharacterized membrane protein YtjA (UPF0391 family)
MRRRNTRLAFFVFTVIAALLGFAGLASAATFTVTNLGDTGVAGDGSLRGEVAAANAAPDADTIVFAPGLAGTITLGGTEIVIDGPLDIEGPGPTQITIRQTAAHRVFEVEEIGGAAVKIAGLHLAGGIAPGSGPNAKNGGDLLNEGADLTLEDDLITGGEAEGDGGGVFCDEGPLTVRSSTVGENSAGEDGGVAAGAPWSVIDSTISGNEATKSVGGIAGSAGSGVGGLIERSTISGNTAGEDTGGASLFAVFGGEIIVRNSTISGNTVAEEAGGLDAFTLFAGLVAIEGSTIAANSSGGGAGGISFQGEEGDLKLTDAIVADNASAGGVDLKAESPPATAFSLIGGSSGPTFTDSVPGSDVLGVAARLEPLADNGGPTETMAPAPTSPVVNKGAGALSIDQRGDPRPVIYPGVGLSAAPGSNGDDIGAVELAVPAPTATPPPASAPPASAPPPAKALPRVRVSCPKGAKPGGCAFALQVVSAKPKRQKAGGDHRKVVKPIAESAVAKLKLGPGRSALVTITPKPKFTSKLAAAGEVLVRESETTKGVTHTAYRRLKVIG